MSVLINGIDKPENCSWHDHKNEQYLCPLLDFDANCILQNEHFDCFRKQYANCPLIEVKDCIERKDAYDAVDQRIEELIQHPEFVKKHGYIDVVGVKRYINKIQSLCSRH